MALIRLKLPMRYSKMTRAQRAEAREDYWALQKGKCYHCNGDLNRDPPEAIQRKRVNWSLFPKGFQEHPHHLHHSHETGMTLGVVHMRCNAILWQYHGE